MSKIWRGQSVTNMLKGHKDLTDFFSVFLVERIGGYSEGKKCRLSMLPDNVNHLC